MKQDLPEESEKKNEDKLAAKFLLPSVTITILEQVQNRNFIFLGMACFDGERGRHPRMLVYIGGLEIIHLLSVLVRVHPGLCATNQLEQVRRYLVKCLQHFQAS